MTTKEAPKVEPKQFVLENATEIELKAMAYDQLALIEQAQANLRAINEELRKRQQPKAG